MVVVTKRPDNDARSVTTTTSQASGAQNALQMQQAQLQQALLRQQQALQQQQRQQELQQQLQQAQHAQAQAQQQQQQQQQQLQQQQQAQAQQQAQQLAQQQAQQTQERNLQLQHQQLQLQAQQAQNQRAIQLQQQQLHQQQRQQQSLEQQAQRLQQYLAMQGRGQDTTSEQQILQLLTNRNAKPPSGPPTPTGTHNAGLIQPNLVRPRASSEPNTPRQTETALAFLAQYQHQLSWAHQLAGSGQSSGQVSGPHSGQASPTLGGHSVDPAVLALLLQQAQMQAQQQQQPQPQQQEVDHSAILQMLAQQQAASRTRSRSRSSSGQTSPQSQHPHSAHPLFRTSQISDSGTESSKSVSGSMTTEEASAGVTKEKHHVNWEDASSSLPASPSTGSERSAFKSSMKLPPNVTPAGVPNPNQPRPRLAIKVASRNPRGPPSPASSSSPSSTGTFGPWNRTPRASSPHAASPLPRPRDRAPSPAPYRGSAVRSSSSPLRTLSPGRLIRPVSAKSAAVPPRAVSPGVKPVPVRFGRTRPPGSGSESSQVTLKEAVFGVKKDKKMVDDAVAYMAKQTKPWVGEKQKTTARDTLSKILR